MSGNCMILDKIESVALISGELFTVDTKGLCCKMKVAGGSIKVNMNENDNDAYMLYEGEEMDFCGKIYYWHFSGSPLVSLLYYHTL